MGVLVLDSGLRAAEPAPTTLLVEGGDCQGCVKKVVTKLSQVPGVAAVQVNVDTATVTVIAQAQKAPSPRALWEAVDQSGFKPTELNSPAGTFTAKPKNEVRRPLATVVIGGAICFMLISPLFDLAANLFTSGMKRFWGIRPDQLTRLVRDDREEKADDAEERSRNGSVVSSTPMIELARA